MDAAGGRTGEVRPCETVDRPDMLAIINAAAEAYRGVIPADRWHDPYMPNEELRSEIADGVVFSGYFEGKPSRVVAVMGVQRRGDIDLIRHAYVSPAWQGRGIGGALLRQALAGSAQPFLVGTWRAAGWAVRFYERYGFARVADEEAVRLLRTYWSVPERQIAASTVLARSGAGRADLAHD